MVRTFPCGCGEFVRYHRYKRTGTSAAQTSTFPEARPEPGVWRNLQTIDDVLAANPQDYPLPSEELRIARRGMRFRGADLGHRARELTAAIEKNKRARQNVDGEGRRVEPDFTVPCDELERLTAEARRLKLEYCIWKQMKETLEKQEYGKVTAVEMWA